MRSVVPDRSTEFPDILSALGRRSIVLVGSMGAGKSSIGKKLAERLCLTFVDSDIVVERQCGMPIADFVDQHGEPEFRYGEARVIARLLRGGPQVLATGGGSFCSLATQAAIRAEGLSVWLKADAETLLSRVLKRSRPMLEESDPAAAFRRLVAEQDRFHAAADISIELKNRQRDRAVQELLDMSDTIVRLLLRDR